MRLPGFTAVASLGPGYVYMPVKAIFAGSGRAAGTALAQACGPVVVGMGGAGGSERCRPCKGICCGDCYCKC